MDGRGLVIKQMEGRIPDEIHVESGTTVVRSSIQGGRERGRGVPSMVWPT
jgi:hypothetical protein